MWQLISACLIWLPAAVAGVMTGTIFFLQLAALGLPMWAFPPASGPDAAVQNYVLFNKVPFGEWTVTTGTRFASTHDPSISDQWCYVQPAMTNTDYTVIHIAEFDADRGLTVLSPSYEALATLELDGDGVTQLVHSHCRFQ